MLGADSEPVAIDQMLLPSESWGVRCISIGYFVPDGQAVIWRGPMLHKALEQFLADVFWDDPDFLLVDMPPGTGDIAISLSQYLPRGEVYVVTTPQPAAQKVARLSAAMAAKVNLTVRGVIENMSWFTGDDGKRYELFGRGGGADARRRARRAAARPTPARARRCARAATTAGRSPPSTRTARPGRAFHELAERIAVDLRPQEGLQRRVARACSSARAVPRRARSLSRVASGERTTPAASATAQPRTTAGLRRLRSRRTGTASLRRGQRPRQVDQRPARRSAPSVGDLARDGTERAQRRPSSYLATERRGLPSTTDLGGCGHRRQLAHRGASIALVVLSIIWLYRVPPNHRALGRALTWAPGWAIGGWFLPPLLYVIPLLVLREAWKAADPAVPPGSPDVEVRSGETP